MSAAIRPSFSVDLACPSQQVLERLFARLDAGPHQLRRTRSFGGGARDEGPRDHDHFVLTVAEAQQHFWSPWLNVEVKPQGEGAHLFARFGPHPSVWTFFAFAYLGLSVVLLSLCFSAALVASGGSPWALGVSAAAALIMLGMWAASQVGQRLSHDQMGTLRAELESAIETCIEPPRP